MVGLIFESLRKTEQRCGGGQLIGNAPSFQDVWDPQFGSFGLGDSELFEGSGPSIPYPISIHPTLKRREQLPAQTNHRPSLSPSAFIPDTSSSLRSTRADHYFNKAVSFFFFILVLEAPPPSPKRKEKAKRNHRVGIIRPPLYSLLLPKNKKTQRRNRQDAGSRPGDEYVVLFFPFLSSLQLATGKLRFADVGIFIF